MILSLEKAAKDAFGFLETKYRFSCVESGPWSLQYESLKVFVSVDFDGMRSYELGCSIGRLDDLEALGKFLLILGR